MTSDGGEKTRWLAPFRIAVQALYRFSARLVTAVPSELTLWTAVARSECLRRQYTRSGSARAGDALAFRRNDLTENMQEACARRVRY
jgi:hypothetical protein